MKGVETISGGGTAMLQTNRYPRVTFRNGHIGRCGGQALMGEALYQQTCLVVDVVNGPEEGFHFVNLEGMCPYDNAWDVLFIHTKSPHLYEPRDNS